MRLTQQELDALLRKNKAVTLEGTYCTRKSAPNHGLPITPHEETRIRSKPLISSPEAKEWHSVRKGSVPIDRIIEVYKETGSVWKTGKIVGLCGQNVWERLEKLGLVTPLRILSEEEKNLIREVYSSGITRGDGKLEDLSMKIGRTKPFICRYARTEGLTSNHRGFTEEVKKANSVRIKDQWKMLPHPKGFLGKVHSEKTKQLISDKGMGRIISSETVEKSMRTRLERYGSLNPKIKRGSWKAEWHEFGGKRFFARSKWESNYARYLQFLKDNGQIKEWHHEPETFWFKDIMRGCRSYLPDFKVQHNDGSFEFHEVKGWMDDRSKTKIKRMAKYHPDVRLIVRDSTWYKTNKRTLSSLVPGWEL